MKPKNIINRDPPDGFQPQDYTPLFAKRSPCRESEKKGTRWRNETTSENTFTLAELLRVLALVGFGTIVVVLCSLHLSTKWFSGKFFKIGHRPSRFADPSQIEKPRYR